MSINELFFKYYTYIYSVFYNSPNYKINTKNIKLYTSRLEGFKKRLSKKININSIGKQWVFDYCTYQFYRLENAEFKRTFNGYNTGRIIFDDLTRTKSMEMFLESYNNIHSKYFQEKFCFKYNLYLQNIDKEIVKASKIDNEQNNRLKDIERKRFLNTENGLDYCIEQQLIFDNQSVICNQCKFKQECYDKRSINSKTAITN